MSPSATLSNRCPYCDQWHSSTCPRIKAIEYHLDGTIRRLEFWPETPSQDIPIQPVMPTPQPVRPWTGT